MMRSHSNVGHIYVALLDGGIVKTGKTKQPKTRISKSGFGNREILDYWVSVEFVGYSSAESEMINFLSRVGKLAFGREYFSCVDFSVAVEYAAKCVNSRSSLCVKEQKTKDHNRISDAASMAISHFSGEGLVDYSWTSHVREYRKCAEVVSTIISKNGVRGSILSPVDALEGMSILEFSMIICSYHCNIEPIEYFADVTNTVIVNRSMDDDDFIEWVLFFYDSLSNEIIDLISIKK